MSVDAVDRSWGAAVLATLGLFDALVEVDGDATVRGWNDRAETMFGRRRDEVIGRTSLTELVVATDRKTLMGALSRAGAGGSGSSRSVLELMRAHGESFHAEVTICPGDPSDGANSGALVVIEEVAADPSLSREVADESPDLGSDMDPGGLVSRSLFLDLLADAHQRRPLRGAPLVVLRVQIDPRPDGSRAHGPSDNYPFAEECAALCRAAGNDGVVATFDSGGFGLLLDGLGAPYHAVSLADRICAAFRERADPPHQAPYSTVSIGIGSLDDTDVLVAADVLLHAELALDRAQQQGGDRYEVFDPRLRDEIHERMRVRNELYDSIDAGHFRVHYQPAFSLTSRRVVMVEGLVRWDHPTRGLVVAGEFIDLAEEHNLIMPLGAWVLNEACVQLRAWGDVFGADAPKLAVNFSPQQFFHPSAVMQVAGVIDANNLDPADLLIEVTESTLTDHPEKALVRLHELKDIGVGLSIDHFGVGPSSLTFLQRLPVDLVKIDRSLVGGAVDGDQDRTVASAIADVGHSRGMNVAVEGVETEAQLAAVRQLGIDQAQGYHLGRPQPAIEITHLIAAGLLTERSA